MIFELIKLTVNHCYFFVIAPIAKCILGQGVDGNGECIPCPEEEGRVVDSRGRCVCDTERGYTPRGDVCMLLGCTTDSECDDRDRCINGACVNACEAEPCGFNATCDAYGHRSHCTCITGYVGNPRIQCTPSPTETNYRTDFPLPEMEVRRNAIIFLNHNLIFSYKQKHHIKLRQ